jgi:hypothetical protein
MIRSVLGVYPFSINLASRGIVDKNNQKDLNSGLVLPAGETRILKLSGKTA